MKKQNLLDIDWLIHLTITETWEERPVLICFANSRNINNKHSSNITKLLLLQNSNSSNITKNIE